MIHDPSELTPTERVALVTADLYSGGTVTTAAIANRFGITRVGAWYILAKISRVLPIVMDDDGQWFRLTPD